jgi:hypothetical protein
VTVVFLNCIVPTIEGSRISPVIVPKVLTTLACALHVPTMDSIFVARVELDSH